MVKGPKLKPGQVSLLCCDLNTGHVLKANGDLHTQTGNAFETFDSFGAVEQHISAILLDKPDMEFIVYGHDGEAVLSWSRLEKRKLR